MIPELPSARLIRNREQFLGYQLVNKAPWLNPHDWNEAIISRDKIGRVRIVLIDAVYPRSGAFTRLIAGIKAAGLVPVIVEPFEILEEWCKRHNWKRRTIGQGDNRQTIWYERIEGIE